MIYEINHIWTAEMKWKWRNDRRSERNLCNCVKKPEKKKKFQDFNGVWTRDLAIPVRCSTNWAMKPSLLKRTSYWYTHFQSLWSRICFMVKVACRKPGKRFQIRQSAQSKLLYTDVDPSDKVSCFFVFRFWILSWLISLMHASWNLLSLAQQISTLKTGERTQSIGQVRYVHGTPCM